MHAVGDTGTSPVPAFLSKLWTLVEDPSTDEFICWDVSGKSFHVFDQGRFSKEVLPLYFKHSNIASFIRQLNMYGFRKVVGVESGGLKVEKDDMEFAHQYFQRGNESLLEHIKRKVPNVKTDEMKVRHDDVQRVLNDVRTMKGKQDSVTNKLEGVKRENELLWLEIASLRQKHMKQQQIVNKLIHFLMSLVGNRGVDRKRKMPLMINDASQLESAKMQKFNPSLSIHPGGQGYKVTSPEVHGGVDEGPTSTLSIHEVTDQMPSTFMEASSQPTAMATATATTSTIPTACVDIPGLCTLSQTDDGTDILEALVAETTIPPMEEMAAPVDESQPIFTLSTDALPLEPEDLTQAPSMIPSEQPGNVKVEAPQIASSSMEPTGVTDAVLGAGAVVPASTSRSTNPKVLNREMSDHIDLLQSDLDSLKELLSGGQYTFEPSTIMGMFELGNLMSDQQPSTSSADHEYIVGNEVIQYNPPEDIASLFDLGDLSSSTPLDEDDVINNSSTLNTPFVRTDDEGPQLLAPGTTMTTSTEEVD